MTPPTVVAVKFCCTQALIWEAELLVLADPGPLPPPTK